MSLVDVCLPTALHRQYAERAFAAGKDVLLEKPLALTLEDAEAILEAARRSGRTLLVGLVLRFWPEYQELHALVEGGEIGAVQSVSTLRLSPPADWNDWNADAAQSGGVAVDLVIHDFDQLEALLGPARTVAARAVRGGAHGAPQHVVCVTEHERGSGLAEGSMMLPSSYPFTSNIRVLGERGILEYPFSAAPAADGGNIGGVDQARQPAAACYPADGDGARGRRAERRPVAPPGRVPARPAGGGRGPDPRHRRAGAGRPPPVPRREPLAGARHRRVRLVQPPARPEDIHEHWLRVRRALLLVGRPQRRPVHAVARRERTSSRSATSSRPSPSGACAT